MGFLALSFSYVYGNKLPLITTNFAHKYELYQILVIQLELNKYARLCIFIHKRGRFCKEFGVSGKTDGVFFKTAHVLKKTAAVLKKTRAVLSVYLCTMAFHFSLGRRPLGCHLRCYLRCDQFLCNEY